MQCCLECVADCPALGSLVFSAGKRALNPYAMAAAITAGLIAAVSIARVTGHWNSPIPDSVYQRLIPAASELKHTWVSRRELPIDTEAVYTYYV